MSNATRKHRKEDGDEMWKSAKSSISITIAGEPAYSTPAASKEEAVQKGITWLRRFAKINFSKSRK